MPHDISTKFAIVISQRIKVLSWSKKQCKEPNKKKKKKIVKDEFVKPIPFEN